MRVYIFSIMVLSNQHKFRLKNQLFKALMLRSLFSTAYYGRTVDFV